MMYFFNHYVAKGLTLRKVRRRNPHEGVKPNVINWRLNSDLRDDQICPKDWILVTVYSRLNRMLPYVMLNTIPLRQPDPT